MVALSARYRPLPAFVLFLAPFAASCWTNAAEGPTQSWIASAHSDVQTSQELVRQLGAPLYEDRVAAEDKLLELGTAGYQALNAAIDDPNLEIRTRARRLAAGFVERYANRRLERVLSAIRRGEDCGFPPWRSYAAVAGETAEARGVFIEIAERFPGLMQSLLAEAMHPGDLPPETTANPAAPRTHDYHAVPSKRLFGSRWDDDLLIAAAWLHAFSASIETENAERSELVAKVVYKKWPQATSRDFPGTFTRRTAQGRVLRRLVRHWLTQCDDPNQLLFKAIIARAGLFEGAGEELGRRVLLRWANAGRVPAPQEWFHDRTPLLFQYVSRGRRQEDVPMLETFLEMDAAIAGAPRSAGPCRVFHLVEIRDLAAATILEIHQRDPRDYGFSANDAPSDDRALLDSRNIHFASQEARSRAFDRIRSEWRELGLCRPPRFAARDDRVFRYEHNPAAFGTADDGRTDPSGAVTLAPFKPRHEMAALALFHNGDRRRYGSPIGVPTLADNADWTMADDWCWAFSRDGQYVAIGGSVHSAIGTRSGNLVVIHVPSAIAVSVCPSSLRTGPIRAVRFAEDDSTILYHDESRKVVNRPPAPPKPEKRKDKAERL